MVNLQVIKQFAYPTMAAVVGLAFASVTGTATVTAAAPDGQGATPTSVMHVDLIVMASGYCRPYDDPGTIPG